MLNADAIKALSKAEATTAANTAIDAAQDSITHVLALPEDFKVHDLESYLPDRRRARGTMTTSVIKDFAAYAKTHALPSDTDEGEAGEQVSCAAVFIDKDNMSATAVLNLGTVNQPGHADNLAVLKLDRSAAFAAVQAIANGQPRKQTDVAEFLEDWAPFITCRNADVIGTGQAAAAIRTITIEAAKKVTSSEQQLGAEKSAFESVQASSGDNLPTTIEFLLDPPYFGLDARTVTLRLSVLASEKPAIVLRIVKLEEHMEGMAGEFAELVRTELAGAMPVVIGTYRKSN